MDLGFDPFDPRLFDDPYPVYARLRAEAALSRGRPRDLSGIRDYRMLDGAGGVQWPLSEAMAETGFETERRLFGDGRFVRASGRALFAFEAPRPVAEPVDEEFPFVLLTGRGSSAQWHTETRTGKSSVLALLKPSGGTRLQMNPADVVRLGLEGSVSVEVRSRRGRVRVGLWSTAAVPPGAVFLEMHDPETNRLTHPDFDPYSRQPSYKHCAVAVRAAGPAATAPGVDGEGGLLPVRR